MARVTCFSKRLVACAHTQRPIGATLKLSLDSTGDNNHTPPTTAIDDFILAQSTHPRRRTPGQYV